MAALSITSQSENKLCEFNTEIVKNLLLLKQQRNEALELIEKQKSEKNALEMEMQKLAYKMQMLDKGLCQRLLTLETYNAKIKEAERKYAEIVMNSETLLDMVKNNLLDLENIMNKKVGTTLCSSCNEGVCDANCPNSNKETRQTTDNKVTFTESKSTVRSLTSEPAVPQIDSVPTIKSEVPTPKTSVPNIDSAPKIPPEPKI